MSLYYKNKEEMMKSVKENGFNIAFVSLALKEDKELHLAAVRQNGMAILCIGSYFYDDEEVAMEAVKQNGLVLGHLYFSLKAHRNINLAAVQQNGFALEHVDYKFIHDEEIVIESVKQCKHLLPCISKALLHDNSFLVKAIDIISGIAA